MKSIEKVSEGSSYTAATAGSFDKLGEFTYVHPMGIEVPGKVFTSEALHTTGTEVSFQTMPVGGGISFLHTHKENEELYIVVSGEGEFQVDGTIFPIAEGSLVRVAPAGKRAWRNTGSVPLVMMVIQSKEKSLDYPGIADGSRVNGEVNW